jgi:hypothetical protein
VHKILIVLDYFNLTQKCKSINHFSLKEVFYLNKNKTDKKHQHLYCSLNMNWNWKSILSQHKWWLINGFALPVNWCKSFLQIDDCIFVQRQMNLFCLSFQTSKWKCSLCSKWKRVIVCSQYFWKSLTSI